MATQFWVGDGGTNLWNTAGCWANVSGGAGGTGAVPNMGDNVILDALSLQPCTMDVNSANGLNSFVCTGYVNTFNQAGFTIFITGPTFTLSAGMTFNHGNGTVQFNRTALSTAVTSAGKTLYDVFVGNGGAGGGAQQLDALTVAHDFLHLNGNWITNNFNLAVGRNFVLYPALLVNDFQAGSSVIAVGGNVAINSVALPFQYGTSTLDLVAVAGTSLLTTNGNGLYNLRVGNAGAGGTYQLQDALTVTGNLNHVDGIFQTNNRTLVMGSFTNVATADGFQSGSSTVTCNGNLTIRKNSWHTPGTSLWRFPNACNWDMQGNSTDFYNLYIGNNQVSVTTLYGLNSIAVSNQFTSGTGSLINTQAGTNSDEFIVGNYTVASLADCFLPNPAFTIDIQTRIQTGGATNVNFNPCIYAPSGIRKIILYWPNNGSCQFIQTANITVTGAMQLTQFSAGNPKTCKLNLNGFNLTVTDSFTHGNAGTTGNPTVTVGNAAMTVGSIVLSGLPGGHNMADRQMYVIDNGSVVCNGDFSYTNTSYEDKLSVVITGTGYLQVGGNWSTSGIYVWRDTALSTSTVRFSKAGAFTIACRLYELWPIVVVNNGGVFTTPVGWNVYDLVATNAVIAINTPVVIRHIYTVGGSGTVTMTSVVSVGSGFVTLPGATVNYGTGGAIEPTGAGFTLDLQSVLPFFAIGPEVARLQVLRSCTITQLVIEDRYTPLVIQMLAGGTFTVTTLTNNLTWPVTCVQLLSSVPGTKANLTVGAFSSTFNLWPKDVAFLGAVIVGGLSNKLLGNVTGGSFNSDGQLRGITDDPGWNDLAGVEIGGMEYCWLVSTTLVGLTALAAAFGAGAKNWHRRTRLPFAVLDNLNIGTGYFISYGLRDDRDRRIAPTIAAGGYFEGTAFSGSGGGGGLPQKIVATSKFAF